MIFCIPVEKVHLLIVNLFKRMYNSDETFGGRAFAAAG